MTKERVEELKDRIADVITDFANEYLDTSDEDVFERLGDISNNINVILDQFKDL